MLVNGKKTDTVSAADRGFQYGDGVFETIKLAGSKPEFWARHMERLEKGCEVLGIPAPDGSLLRREADAVCTSAADGVLKIMVTRGIGGRGYRAPDNPEPTRVAALYPPPDYPEEFWRDGVRVRVCETRMGDQAKLAGLKHMNRLEQILARAEWTGAETAEGLMMDARDNVIEGTMTNLFVVKGGALVTPGLWRCGVAGIVRSVILELAQEAGLKVDIRDMPAAALADADEMFLTNSVIGVWPVRELETAKFVPGPVTQKLRAAFEEMPKA